MNALMKIVGFLAIVGSALSAQAEEPSARLKVLDRFVGTWHGTVVVTDADGNETTTEDDATMQWVLGNSYIEDKIGDGHKSNLTGTPTFQ